MRRAGVEPTTFGSETNDFLGEFVHVAVLLPITPMRRKTALRVYDAAGNLIETREHKAISNSGRSSAVLLLVQHRLRWFCSVQAVRSLSVGP